VILAALAAAASLVTSSSGAAASIASFIAAPADRAALAAYLDDSSHASAKRIAEATGSDPAAVRAALLAQVTANLAAKRALPKVGGKPFTLGAEELRRTVVDYELWKAETFVSAGVFPKRYFGYLDGKWDTASWEKTLRETVHAAVKVVNGYQSAAGHPVRITDAEVAVTFLAEGGAILLREEQAHLDDIHPVYGIGMDDIGSGLAKYPGLAKSLDDAVHADLLGAVAADGGEFKGATIHRNLTFREAIAGTSLMYLYEKELAAGKMRKEQGTDLSTLPLDRQLVVGSLFYNSGILFAPERVEQIRTFTTGPYLADLNSKLKNRPQLPVAEPASSLRAILAGGYPDQQTSWNAVYHVLQRYGGYVGLKKMTDDFDANDSFR
jgi:hypothetical protein